MENKKISFGFSKVKLKSSLLPQHLLQSNQKVEYISSFNKDEKRNNEIKEPELIIPSMVNYTVAERILSKRMKDEKISGNNENNTAGSGISTKAVNGETLDSPIESKISIENQAIQELFQESKKLAKDDTSTLAIHLTEKVDEIEIADDSVDYDSVPVSQFGYAMLRGMGWEPGKGIGKKQKVVEVQIPELRARGLGLGANSSSLKSKPEMSKS